jgi:cell division protein FtsW (lipid II flippase)
MKEEYIFYLAFGLTTLLGLILSLSQMFNRTKSKIYRALFSATGGTIFGISLLLIFFYTQSPKTFWREWNLITVFTFTLCIVIPLFFVLLAGILVQFTVLEKWEEAGKQILGKLTKK